MRARALAEQVELRIMADTIRHVGATERAQARTLLHQALALSEQLANPFAIGVNYEFLGRLEEQEEQREAAIAAYGQALQHFEQIGSPRAEGVRAPLRAQLHALALLDEEAGQIERARAGLQAALRLARELGDKAAQSFELQTLGALDLRHGDAEQARSELVEALILLGRCNNQR